MVDRGREDVHEEDGQHHAFGKGRVQHPDEDRQDADQEAVDVLAGVRVRRRHRIGANLREKLGKMENSLR